MKYVYLGILAIVLSACQQNRSSKHTAKTSDAAIEDSLQPKENEPFAVYEFDDFEPFLHQNDGRVHVINFWATFCPPCIREMPYFEKLNKETDAKVLLVSLDMGMMMDDDLKPFLKKHPIKAKLVVLDDPDSQKWIPKVSPKWNSSLPATLIYKNNRSKFFERPFKSYRELAAEVKRFQ